MIGPGHWLLLGALLVTLGLYLALASRSRERALAGALIVGAAGMMNLVAFARHAEGGVHGLLLACLAALLFGLRAVLLRREGR